MATVNKRRHVERSPTPEYRLDDEENDSYEPYIPVAQRKQARLAELLTKSKEETEAERVRRERLEQEEKEDEEREEERRRERARKERTLLLEAQEVHSRRAAEGECFLYLSAGEY